MRMGFWGGHGPGWAAFGVGGGGRRPGRRFKRGILKFVLLKLLAESPRHGYDLIQSFRKKGWGGGAGSVYPILSALEEAGLIAGREEGERRTYEITDKGRRFLDEHVDDIGSFFDEESEGDGEPDARVQLREAAGRLMQAVSQLSGDSKPETIERVRELLDGTRKQIYTILAQE